MSSFDNNKSVLEIINEVERFIGVKPSPNLDANLGTRKRLQMLNDVISEINEFADWEEDYFEISVSAQTNQKTIDISTFDINIKRIEEVAFESNPSKMRKVEKERMRQLTRLDFPGMPVHWCFNGTDDRGFPIIIFSPKVASYYENQLFYIYGYSKPPYYTCNDSDLVPQYPAVLILKGLHFKVMLELHDGGMTAPVRALQEEYLKSLREQHNRFTNDTGNDLQIVPRTY